MTLLHTGTVQLTAGKTVLIPAATSDPNDPLNLLYWWKILIVVNMSLFSATTLSLISGLGGILQFYAEKDDGSLYDTSDLASLMTYPVITMGVGCLLGLPLSLALGRRAVMIGASAIAVISAALCATAKTYTWHLSARMTLGLAAGQSEVLIPIIVQECFFLHQRSRCLLIQQAVQTTIATVLILLASPIANSLSPESWYGIGAGLAAASLVLTVLSHPDTLYDRPISAYAGVKGTISAPSLVDSALASEILCLEKPPVAASESSIQIWLLSLRVFRHPPRWQQAGLMLKDMFQCLGSPILWWAILTNALALGTVIAGATVYGTILSGAPYYWPSSTISYTNAGQIAVALVAIPILGYGSDSLIQWIARRNKGIHEPEARLIPAISVVAMGVLANALFAAASVHRRSYSSAVFVWCLAANNFYFTGINIVCFTFFLDTFAGSADYMLVVSFLVENSYVAAFSTFAALAALTGILNGMLYKWGKALRKSASLRLRRRSE